MQTYLGVYAERALFASLAGIVVGRRSPRYPLLAVITIWKNTPPPPLAR